MGSLLRGGGLAPSAGADPRRRFAAALGASIAIHACLLAAQGGGNRAAAPAPVAVDPLNVRLVQLPAAAKPEPGPLPASSVKPVSAPAAANAPGRGQNREGRALRSVVAGASAGSAAASSKAAPETKWYTALELDTYPRAETPIGIPAAAGYGRGAVESQLMLWLRIDETGRVAEVSAGAPGMPAGSLEAARSALATARFTPARKDARAVRSRLLVSVPLSSRK